LDFCRDMYQLPGMADTINMEHIKTHYFTSHPELNWYAVIPQGSDFLGELGKPHTRHRSD